MSVLKTKDTEYLRISGYVKGLENRLICGRVLDAVIDAPDYAAALNVLAENGYDCSSADLSADPEDLLGRQAAEVYSFFEHNVPDKGLVRVFRIPRDYLNLKLCVKAEHCGADAGRFLVPAGRVPAGEFIDAVRRRSGLPGLMLRALSDAADDSAKIGDPRRVDIVCDRYCFEEMSLEAKASGYAFVEEYAAQKADAANMSAFIRLKRAGLPLQMFTESYVRADGCIGVDFFEEFYDKDLASVAASLPLNSSLSRGGPDIEDDIKNGRADMIGTRLDRLTVETLRLTAFGPQVPFSYLLARTAELSVLRAVLRGKRRGASSDAVRERLGVSS